MRIIRLNDVQPEIKMIWEAHMNEPWADYEKATHFIQEDNDGTVAGGFSVYYDESDGVCGNFISGWSRRKNISSVCNIIQNIADMIGEIYIKTDKRNVKILALCLGNLVKHVGSFSYYIIRGKDNGKSN